jgi:hypothetical protein
MVLDGWSQNNMGGPTWPIKDMCTSVKFAAYRILERSFMDDGTEMFAKDTDKMKQAIARFSGIAAVVDETEEEDIIKRLKTPIGDLYVSSFSVLSASIRTHGIRNMHEWLPTFQEYQNMLASAHRYIRK